MAWRTILRWPRDKKIPAAGGMLRRYYTDDRMLAWDEKLEQSEQSNDRFCMNIQ
ncbi:hypothetical protein ABZ837_24550 [Streptomyces sp. NPDC047197]|uniref:hypothetical protein n=1 Tax=Streptomyces sp. NPDC047197 TaxID=3155477 RepID=UPI0033C20A14